MNELDKITEERDSKRKDHETLRKKRLDEFMAGFTVITMKLKEMYQVRLTVGTFFRQKKGKEKTGKTHQKLEIIRI